MSPTFNHHRVNELAKVRILDGLVVSSLKCSSVFDIDSSIIVSAQNMLDRNLMIYQEYCVNE